MAYIPVSKKTGEAIAKELEHLMRTADLKSSEMGNGKFPFYYGYINSVIDGIISQLKIGGILIADKK